MVDWDKFLNELKSFPSNVYNLRPPCSLSRLGEAELHFGNFPIDLSEMLKHFNGGELFIRTGPLITLFGLFQHSEKTEFAWYDWYIDIWTPKWRLEMKRPEDWVIGMTNYGGVVILNNELLIGEWDSNEHQFMDKWFTYIEWIEKILSDGIEYLNQK
jgi:hypothetical protein